MELKPINPADFVDLHKRLGIALWQCQSAEETLTYFIALVLKLPPSRAEAEAVAVLEKLQSSTLGDLVRELKKANTTNSVSEFERWVDHFVSERNWLVHRSWREQHTVLFSPEKLPPLYARISKLTADAESFRTFLVHWTTQWTLSQPGVTAEKLAEEQARILRERRVVAIPNEDCNLKG